MAHLQVSIIVPKPVDQVWSALSTLERHSEWMADAESIEFLTDARRGVGTEMRVLTKVGPFSTNDIIRVEEWVEPTTIGVTHQGLVTGAGRFSLEPLDGATRFIWDEDLRFPWYLGGGATAAVAAPILRRIWSGNLRRFVASLD